MVSFSDFYSFQFIINSVGRIIYNVTSIIASFDQKPTNILNFLLFIFKFFFIALIFLLSLVPQYLTKFGFFVFVFFLTFSSQLLSALNILFFPSYLFSLCQTRDFPVVFSWPRMFFLLHPAI